MLYIEKAMYVLRPHENISCFLFLLRQGLASRQGNDELLLPRDAFNCTDAFLQHLQLIDKRPQATARML
jgi:hypothetical protein